jgi:hypothetical protein
LRSMAWLRFFCSPSSGLELMQMPMVSGCRSGGPPQDAEDGREGVRGTGAAPALGPARRRKEVGCRRRSGGETASQCWNRRGRRRRRCVGRLASVGRGEPGDSAAHGSARRGEWGRGCCEGRAAGGGGGGGRRAVQGRGRGLRSSLLVLVRGRASLCVS